MGSRPIPEDERAPSHTEPLPCRRSPPVADMGRFAPCIQFLRRGGVARHGKRMSSTGRKLERVRTPRQWWHARIILFGAVGLWLAIFIIDTLLVFFPRGIRLNSWSWVVATGVAASVFFWSEFFVHRAWAKRILEHDGLMCPQCAYPLAGCPDEEAGVTCPECGNVTQDTSQLFERWRTSLNRFFRYGNQPM